MPYVGSIDISDQFYNTVRSQEHPISSFSAPPPAFEVLRYQTFCVKLAELDARISKLVTNYKITRDLFISAVSLSGLMSSSAVMHLGHLREAQAIALGIIAETKTLTATLPALSSEAGPLTYHMHACIQGLRARLQPVLADPSGDTQRRAETAQACADLPQLISRQQNEEPATDTGAGVEVEQVEQEQEVDPSLYYGVEIVLDNSLGDVTKMAAQASQIEQISAEIQSMSAIALQEIMTQGEVISGIHDAAVSTEFNAEKGLLLVRKATERVYAATNRALILIFMAMLMLVFIDFKYR